MLTVLSIPEHYLDTLNGQVTYIHTSISFFKYNIIYIPNPRTNRTMDRILFGKIDTFMSLLDMLKKAFSTRAGAS